MINRQNLERTTSLSEATEKIFGIYPYDRICLFPRETMTGEVAIIYDRIGKENRKETYQKIARDFRTRTNCYSLNYLGRNWPSVGTILEVGCGSGLLSLELAQETNGNILGIDISEDMLNLAKINLQERKDLLKKIEFRQGSVYELEKLVQDKKEINYVVCRNAFHRFKNPEIALEQMYSVLEPNGKIYIRDLRRDAKWEIIKKRIGEQRWKNLELVKDYIGAMAQTLTTDEMFKLFEKTGIPFEYISTKEEAEYKIETNIIKNPEQIDEYETEMDFVCVISKK